MTRTRTSPPIRRHRLLVVDDEPYNVDLVRRTFRRTSTVFAAADLGAACAVLTAEAIDLVVVDYQLGAVVGGLHACAADGTPLTGSNGLDLARAVRAQRPAAVIVMVTGYAEDPALLAALRAGELDELIAKPWTPSALRQRVEALLARPRP